jgi:transposase
MAVAQAQREMAVRPSGERWAVANEALDARAVAHLAEAVRPTPRPLPDAPTEERRAPVARRRPRIARRPAAPHRLGGASGRLRADRQAHRTWLDQWLVARDDAGETRRRARPVWRARDEWSRRVPGLGPVWARTLGLELPALGTLSRQRLAALVGVAPCKRDRGTRRGRRTSGGGRAPGRAVLSRRTWVAGTHHPVRNACDGRVCAAGKAKQVARTACRRKWLTILNAGGTPQAPGPPREVSIAEKYPMDPGPSRQLLGS